MRTPEPYTRGFICRRGKIWRREYRQPEHRRWPPLKTSSRQTAEARRRALITRLESSELPDATDPVLGAVAELVRVSYEARGRPATVIETTRTWQRFAEDCRAHTLSRATRADVDAYVATRRKNGAWAKTLNNKLQLVRAGVNRLWPGPKNPLAKYGKLREDDSQEVGAVDPTLIAEYLKAPRGCVGEEPTFLALMGAPLPPWASADTAV